MTQPIDSQRNHQFQNARKASIVRQKNGHNVRQRRCVNAVAARGQYQWDDWQLSAVVSGQRLSIEREFLFGPQYSWQPERWRQNTQELRLSTRPRDPQAASSRNWDGVFGLYRQQVNQSRHYTIDMVAPARAPFLDSQSRNKGESVSAYGDVTWYVAPKVDLSAGLRVSRDRAGTNFAGDLMGSPVAGDRSTRQNTWLGRIGAGYRFAPQWRGYVNVAQGYKPAGYALAPTSAADAEGFERERSTSYEIGARYTSGSLRMSMAAYRVDTRDAHVFRPRVCRIGGKQRRLTVFQAKRFDHADAGHALLGAIVQRRKRRLRQLEALVQLFAIAIDRQRHDRHRQQGEQGQLPADLRGHHDQHRTAHHQRVHQRQHSFPGGKDHAIDVVRRAGDEIPGAMTKIKFGMLSAQLAVKIFT